MHSRGGVKMRGRREEVSPKINESCGHFPEGKVTGSMYVLVKPNLAWVLFFALDRGS